MSNKKNIFDYSQVKSVSVSILTDAEGDLQGKIISNWSNNPSGTVCTSQIILFKDFDNLKPKKVKTLIGNQELEFNQILIGKAGGYGYCKLSQSIASAIFDNCLEYPKTDFGSCGIEAVAKYFKTNFDLNLIEIL